MGKALRVAGLGAHWSEDEGGDWGSGVDLSIVGGQVRGLHSRVAAVFFRRPQAKGSCLA